MNLQVLLEASDETLLPSHEERTDWSTSLKGSREYDPEENFWWFEFVKKISFAYRSIFVCIW